MFLATVLDDISERERERREREGMPARCGLELSEKTR
jgi:hypothetical protein